jgi:anti-sigma factor RsiW
MGVSCKEVRRDLSDYIDEELEPFARVAFESHVKECPACAALLDGTRNVIRIYRDACVFAMPDDVRGRLQQRVKQETTPSRRAFLVWTLSAAATIPIGLALFSARNLLSPKHNQTNPSRMQQGNPISGLVVVSDDSKEKVFHLPSCPKLEGKRRFLSVDEAVRESYTPCPYCLGKSRNGKKS